MELDKIKKISIIVCLMLLNACQTNTSNIQTKTHARPIKDSAPTGPIPTVFKAIKLISQPFSRYGNPMTYTVNGHTYNVLTSSSGYKTRGVASWYGTKFHKQRTSSGEKYDMYALTAAHKTLPLPTYLKVKNLENGRVVIVKVNDRGPFHTSRILDLSFGAATKLGIFPKGTAMVEIEALSVPGAAKNHQAHYYLQAGAFSTRQNAEMLRQQLMLITSSPVFITHEKTKYVVRIGPFAERRMTNYLKNMLLKKGVSGVFALLM